MFWAIVKALPTIVCRSSSPVGQPNLRRLKYSSVAGPGIFSKTELYHAGYVSNRERQTDRLAPVTGALVSSNVDCVFLSCFEPGTLFLTSMLGQSAIRLHHACTVEMADFLLLATPSTVLLVDTTFLDGSWEDALAMAAQIHPLVATLVCSDPVDHLFVATAKERGAFEVLWRPIDLGRLRAAIRHAHEATVERNLWLAERCDTCPQWQYPGVPWLTVK